MNHIIWIWRITISLKVLLHRQTKVILISHFDVILSYRIDLESVDCIRKPNAPKWMRVNFFFALFLRFTKIESTNPSEWIPFILAYSQIGFNGNKKKKGHATLPNKRSITLLISWTKSIHCSSVYLPFFYYYFFVLFWFLNCEWENKYHYAVILPHWMRCKQIQNDLKC